jgi:hypothetical protein
MGDCLIENPDELYEKLNAIIRYWKRVSMLFPIKIIYSPENLEILIFTRTKTEGCILGNNIFEIEFSLAFAYKTERLLGLLLLLIYPKREYLLDPLHQSDITVANISFHLEEYRFVAKTLILATNMSDHYYQSLIRLYEDFDTDFIAELIYEFIDKNMQDKLILTIKELNPQKTLEYYSEYDIEKVPTLIELFNQYGKYEEFEL